MLTREYPFRESLRCLCAIAHNFALRHGRNDADFFFHDIVRAGLRLEIDLPDIFAETAIAKVWNEAMRRKSNMTEVQPWASDPQAMCRRARRSY